MQMRERDLLTRLVRVRPLLCAAVLCLTGCALEYALDLPPLALWIFLFLLILAAMLLSRRGPKWGVPLLLLAMLPAGALRFEAQWRALAPLPSQSDVELSGRISQTPVWNSDTERCICVLEDLTLNGVPSGGRLRLYLRGDVEQLQSVELGQCVSCVAHIWQAREATNPGQFNFSNYLRLNGLNGYATAKIEEAQLTPPKYRASDWPEQMRERLGARIDRLFPHNSAIARAFLLGDRSGLSREERENYSRSGVAHLLAISGMHVSVLAAAVSMLLGHFLRRSHAFAVTLALLLGYGALIGFPVALTRAILVFAILGFSPAVGRYSDTPTRLAAAMLACILVRPISILESSFILSYGACAGILLLSAPLTRLVHAEKYLQKRTKVSFKALFTTFLPQWILRSLIVTFAAQLAILPAVVHFFGAQPLWSFAVNLVAVPLAMAAYLLSIAGMLTGFAPVAHAGDLLFGLLTRCVQFFGSLPLASLRIARFPLWLTLLCAIACLLASDLSRLPEKLRRFLPLTVLLAVFLSNFCAQLTTRGCSAVFLDAGQADCAVLRTQGSVYLIDTGDSYTPAADYLSAMNYAVDGVFLSHPHADHAGGLAPILEVCTPGRIYLSPNWGNYEISDEITGALSLAHSRGSELVFLSAGDQLQLSDDTILQVLSPTEGFCANSANDDSLILRIRYGEAVALFCGDAPASIASGLAGDVDLLKLAHHGAADALTPALLEETSPSAAVISVGADNRYGHPAQVSLKLLEASGARIYRTDLCGAITCHIKRNGTLALRAQHHSEDGNELE